MNVKFLPFALALSLVSFCLPTLCAQAQDKGLSPNELVDPAHVETTLNEDHEAKTKLASRDSVSIHNSTPAHTEQKPAGAKEDDDALSFNFLYYIIQKFKISDLIDE
jgi:hypothetical protein